VESSRTDPRILAEHALARHLQHRPTDHPRYEPTPDEYIARIRALTIDDARSFHREFYGASRAQVGLVGDVAPEEVEALVTTLFGAWESRQRYQRIVEPFHRTSPLRWVLETPDKAAAVFQAATPVEVTDSDPDYAALVLGDILTGGTESSRLWRRIRDREGLSYGVESSLTVDAESPSGLFTVTATAEPATAERVERAVVDELGRILREGFDATELARARETWVRQRHLYWAQDDLIADDLVAQTMNGRTFHREAALEEQVAALTPEAVRTAMVRHVSPDRLTVVMAGDFAATRRVAVAADAR
jgi:zinc protease